MCHQSVGLLARYLEGAGIATVVIGALPRILNIVRPPRVYRVQALLGQLVGPPQDRATQQARVMEALSRVVES